MREIDLIPASYRAERARSLRIKVLAGVAGAILLGTLGSRLWLDSALDEVKARLVTLQAQQTLTSQERERLGALTEKRQNYAGQLQMLEGLRSGTAETNLFRAMDEALHGDELWFTSWQFRRAGVTDAEGRAVETGYFLVVADDNQRAGWQVETHMTIVGQAEDHATLSEFVRRLLGRAEIESVSIRRTEVQRQATRSIVDFDLAVVVNRQALD
jgi:Fimbrial assembly protein (PilN)